MGDTTLCGLFSYNMHINVMNAARSKSTLRGHTALRDEIKIRHFDGVSDEWSTVLDKYPSVHQLSSVWHIGKRRSSALPEVTRIS
jgi:hypothetical protein